MAEFNLINPIPRHRLVTISESGSSKSVIGNVPLIIDDEVSIKVSSKFDELWQGSSNNLMTLLSGSFGLPSGQFALQGMQIWKGTDPIKLSFNVHVEMDTNPIDDVVNPIRDLMCIALPRYGNGSEITKDSEGWNDRLEKFAKKNFNLKLKTLIPPGPNLQTIIESMAVKGENESTTIPKAYDITLGWCKFRNMILTSLDPKFSKDVCYVNNKPYPISAELSIEASTLEVATTNMITEML